MDKILDKRIEWVKYGNIKVLESTAENGIKLVQLTKNCCGEKIIFRTSVINGIGDTESIYAFIPQFTHVYNTGVNCACMK